MVVSLNPGRLERRVETTVFWRDFFRRIGSMYELNSLLAKSELSPPAPPAAAACLILRFRRFRMFFVSPEESLRGEKP
jgi:hypothetical protein